MYLKDIIVELRLKSSHISTKLFNRAKLKKEISETTSDIDPDDVLSVKKKLKGFCYYKEPKWGMSKFSDKEMFSAIRKFQADNKLKIDGVIKPKGETETKINEKIINKKWGDKTKKIR